MKLLLMQFCKYFTEINNICLTTSVFFLNKNLELIQNILFMDVGKTINYVAKTIFSVSEGALRKTLEKNSAKWKIQTDI